MADAKELMIFFLNPVFATKLKAVIGLVLNKNYRIAESSRLEKATKIIKPNCRPITTMPTDHVPQHHITQTTHEKHIIYDCLFPDCSYI